MDLSSKITARMRALGAADVGFSELCGQAPFTAAISLVFPLSEAVIDEIDDAPTHTYFHHYRTVNAHIDRCLLELGLFLAEEGYHYLPIPASQSVNGMQGRYSHKQAAAAAGLGTIGRNGLFLHARYGPAVRLGTLFCDAPLPLTAAPPVVSCLDCGRCAAACPAMAIPAGKMPKIKKDESIIDRTACSAYMKKHFQHIGRGAVCGICISVCPERKKA